MDSRTLLSGGEEAVLVFWFEGSNRKDFCPRLYGSINGIFLDNYGEKIAIKYSNNKISVHNSANYKLICLINEIDTSFAVNASISNHKGKYLSELSNLQQAAVSSTERTTILSFWDKKKVNFCCSQKM